MSSISRARRRIAAAVRRPSDSGTVVMAAIYRCATASCTGVRETRRVAAKEVRDSPQHRYVARSGEEPTHRLDRVDLGDRLVVAIAHDPREPQRDAAGIAGRPLHPVERDLDDL